MNLIQKQMDFVDKMFCVNHEAEDHNQIEDPCNNNQTNDDEDLSQVSEDEANMKKSMSINPIQARGGLKRPPDEEIC